MAPVVAKGFTAADRCPVRANCFAPQVARNAKGPNESVVDGAVVKVGFGAPGGDCERVAGMGWW